MSFIFFIGKIDVVWNKILFYFKKGANGEEFLYSWPLSKITVLASFSHKIRPKKEAKQTKEKSSRFFSQHTSKITDAFSCIKHKDRLGFTKNDAVYHFGIAGWTNDDDSSYKALE